jgi:uncharacterized oxidoreductase
MPEEGTPDGGSVGRAGGGELGTARCRRHDQAGRAVGVPGDEASFRHAGELPGQPAAFPAEQPGEFLLTQSTVAEFDDPAQHGEVRPGHAGRGAGGSQGIGLGLAARYRAAGHPVLITGRNPDRLERAAAEHPGLLVYRNDAGRPAEREKLAAHVRATLPGLDVLINNAGIQRRIPLLEDHAPWPDRQAEIDLLLAAPIHLTDLLLPVLLEGGRRSLIVNVTSGGAFRPQPFAPVYSACKAALHSYTENLRSALAQTSCRVVELIPPAVATELAGPGNAHGAPLDDFCDTVFPALLDQNQTHIGYGATRGLR